MWHRLADTGRLKLSLQLTCGQSFRWQPTGDNQWTSVLNDEFIVSLRQLNGSGTVEYCVHSTTTSAPIRKPEDSDLYTKRVHDRLRDYFQLHVDLDRLYDQWSAKDANFARCRSQGHNSQLRILRMEPWDALLSFICSSNNNISRITQMVQKLSQYFGRPLGEAHGISFNALPTAQALVGQEQRLRELGFGYRAKFFSKTAEQLIELAGGGGGGANEVSDYLEQMRQWPYQRCREQLMQLTGVGPKIADCVCLFGLDKGQVVPVDTHVRTIAQRDYGWRGKTDEWIQEAFHERYGPYAGWAHCVLFAADLRTIAGDLNVVSTTSVEGKVSAKDDKENQQRKPSNERKRKTAATVAAKININENENVKHDTENQKRKPSNERKRKTAARSTKLKIDDDETASNVVNVSMNDITVLVKDEKGNLPRPTRARKRF